MPASVACELDYVGLRRCDKSARTHGRLRSLSVRERGAHPTAIADVLEHGGAPRGSAYHYFPGGRTQLLCEAVDFAGVYTSAVLDALDALDGLFAGYRKQLQCSDFRAGCPVVAIADTHGGDKIRYYGGGQGNRLGGAYSGAFLKALGSYHRSDALAQEKTGEHWATPISTETACTD